MAGDLYTFAHQKGIPSPVGDDKSSLKNWKDNFFWLDDLCLPADMVWRFKDQSMDFDLEEHFSFSQKMARDLINNRSPIRPLHEHMLLLGRVCHFWNRGDSEWPLIRKSGERDKMSLKDALKVHSFSTLDFDFEEVAADEEPFVKQIAPAAQEIRLPIDPKAF
ncbi:hypothetical protein Hdeb2414_s0006g00204031 [Helianthus debilis subsp. tardiflorus]